MDDFVLMTYREIAAAMNLSGATSARMKAKRRGWRIVAGNHPRDTVHVEVPQSALTERSDESAPKSLPTPLPIAAEADVLTELRSQIAMLQTQITMQTAQAERDRTDRNTRDAELCTAINVMRAERDAARVAVVDNETTLRTTIAKLLDITARASRAEGQLEGLNKRSWLGRILG